MRETWVSRLLRQYIRRQWELNQRTVSEPQARGELLGGALVYAYRAGTMIPAVTYADELSTVANANPFGFTYHGRLPPDDENNS